MAHPKKVFVSALLSIFTTGLVALAPVQAKLTLINTLLSSSQSEYDKGNYLVSLKLSERALEVAQESKAGPLAEASALLNVTLNRSALGQYDTAEQDFKKLLAMLDQYKLMRCPVAILAFNNYATHVQHLGRYTEAEAFFNKAVDLGTRNFGVNSIQNVLSVNNLASLYLNWGKLKEAEALVDRTIELAKAPKARNTIAGPYSLCNQSKLAELKGDYKEAQVLLQKALEQAITIYGAKHAYVSLIYKNGLAPVAIKKYDFEEAEKYARLSLEIDEKTYGKESLGYAGTLVILAAIEDKEGKYNQAKEHCQTALSTYKKILEGKSTLESINALVVDGGIEGHLGNYEEASTRLKEALKVAREILPADHIAVADILKESALVELDRGAYKEAQQQIEAALSAAKNSVAATNPDLIEIEKSAGHIYRLAGEKKLARAQLEAALAAAEITFSSGSKVSLAIERELAALARELGENEEAANRLKKVISRVEKTEGTESASLIGDLEELAQIQTALKEGEAARASLARANALMEKLPGAGQQTSSAAELPAAAQAPNRPVADKWALVVGISDFKDPTINLKYAAKDATDFANFLTQKSGFRKDHVKLLLNGAATRDGIIRNMGESWLGRLAAPDDLVVLYVSSHGSPANESAEGTNFLVAHDTNKESLISTGIPMQWLSKMVKEQVHAKRVVLILDVCHGAAAAGSKGMNKTSLSPENLEIGEGQMVISSSGKDQISWESKNYANSVFTKNLIESLSREAKPLPEAFSSLKDNVQREVLRDRASLQTPVLWSKQWRGAPPVLTVVPTAPRPGL